MTINEFFEKTFCVTCGCQERRPRIICKDGFSMSVQAGRGIYSVPRRNIPTGYRRAEIGFPSQIEPIIMQYAEDRKDYIETVYPYVPCELIDKVIEMHGGIDEEKTFGVVKESEEE